MAVAGEDAEDDPGMDWQAEYLKKLGEGMGDLRTDIRRLDDRLSREVVELRSVAVTRTEFNSRFDELRTEFTSFQVELGALRRETHTIIRWVIGTIVTMFIGFATVIMKLVT